MEKSKSMSITIRDERLEEEIKRLRVELRKLGILQWTIDGFALAEAYKKAIREKKNER